MSCNSTVKHGDSLSGSEYMRVRCTSAHRELYISLSGVYVWVCVGKHSSLSAAVLPPSYLSARAAFPIEGGGGGGGGDIAVEEKHNLSNIKVFSAYLNRKALKCSIVPPNKVHTSFLPQNLL